MALEYFPCYHSYRKKLAKLSDQEVGRLVRALAMYHASGETQELKGRECGYYDFIKADIDEIEHAYELKCRNMKRQQTAIDSNCPQLPAIAHNCPQQPININNNNISLSGDKETTLTSGKEKRKRFSPPTLEEVSAYCKERGNRIDPQRFVDYYEARGWELKSGQKVKDWKACVRTWEQRDNGQTVQKPKLLRAQMYEQREYKEEEMRKLLGVDDLFKDEVAG